MPNQPLHPANAHVDKMVRSAALEQLRKGRNPFATHVTAVGTEDESIQVSVPEFTAGQFSELLEIIETYREARPPTRVYPLLGDRGSGKTHLLYMLRSELRRRAIQAGEETLLIVVDRLSEGMEPIDYLLWSIVNHLLSQKGDGKRLLEVIAARLSARLLAEALRGLVPHQRAELIPPAGYWEWLRLHMGSAARVQARLDAIEEVIRTCDKRNPSPEDVPHACLSAGLDRAVAFELIDTHLERTESKDVLGWFRSQLYKRLAMLALLGDREPFEEFHAEGYDAAPANVSNAGNLSHRHLRTWIELLTALNIPVVIAFDQLEDYLRDPQPDREKTNRRHFTGSVALFINELKHVCILIFAEGGFWTDLITNAEAFTAERLGQPFALPGRPAKPHLAMPDRVHPDVLTRLVRQRVLTGFPGLDLTGLPPSFPFDEADLRRIQDEPSIRSCLRRLARRYDEIVHREAEPKEDLREKLHALWKEGVSTAEKVYGSEMVFRVAFIPEVQNALHGWLECLDRNGSNGPHPWDRVEIINDPEKRQYGTMSVIRSSGRHAPGIGIAAWLGTRNAQARDLRERLGFFAANPCPIRTLVLLRADGVNALRGETKAVYDQAIKAGRDLRIHKYEPRHLHSLMAFNGWLQAAVAEIDAARDNDPEAETVFRRFLADLSGELLGWIDAWRRPASAVREA